jgi:hypothetical protein
MFSRCVRWTAYTLRACASYYCSAADSPHARRLPSRAPRLLVRTVAAASETGRLRDDILDGIIHAIARPATYALVLPHIYINTDSGRCAQDTTLIHRIFRVCLSLRIMRR